MLEVMCVLLNIRKNEFRRLKEDAELSSVRVYDEEFVTAATKR
jgi:hypothetical protein